MMALSGNLLGREASPYLLQHADNPVHWRPWGAAALQEAVDRNQPILLSVGYSACHWCHVMAHECFEDLDVAEVMNNLFVNIKVDREERPDIDQIYMAALGAMGEQGGWPLTIFLTPQAKPFWGGTYFPKEPRYGRPGFVDVLRAISKAWTTDASRVGNGARELHDHVDARLATRAPRSELRPEDLQDFAASVASAMDDARGGLRGAPKFPNVPFLQTLWYDRIVNRNRASGDHVSRSLETMLRGGIYDHVGGGLHRYATDADWMVPHFEKMLYDNAQLIRLGTWVHAATRSELLRERIEQTVTWLLRDMRTPGGFAASLDADSGGGEGRYYTWTQGEIGAALEGVAELESFFSLARPSTWEGDPILFQTEENAKNSLRTPEAARAVRDRLRAVRESRPAPGRDDKVVIDWNGLAVDALALAGRSFARPDWIRAASEIYATIESSADAGGRLPHATLGERRVFPGLSSDFAAMANAAIGLFEATADTAYVDRARHWLSMLDRWHGDEDGSGHYLTASDATDVPMRPRGDVDEATASATAQILEAKARFAALTGDPAELEAAMRVASHAAGRVRGQAYGQAGILNACAILLNSRRLVITAGAGREALVSVANRYPDPMRTDVLLSGKGGLPSSVLPGSALPRDGEAGAYLCEGQTCQLPTGDPEELAAALASALLS